MKLKHAFGLQNGQSLHCVSSRSMSALVALQFALNVRHRSSQFCIHEFPSVAVPRSVLPHVCAWCARKMGDSGLLRNRVNHITSISCRTYLRVDKHSTPFYCAHSFCALARLSSGIATLFSHSHPFSQRKSDFEAWSLEGTYNLHIFTLTLTANKEPENMMA